MTSILSAIHLIVLACYAMLAIAYSCAQLRYTLRAERRITARQAVPGLAVLPSVDVMIPCYNEDPQTLAACLRSIAMQDYQGKLRVYLVDDGSRNRDLLAPVIGAYAGDPRFTSILLPHNVGKRKAQVCAIRRSAGDLVVNVDSDTTIAADVVRKLVAKMADPAVGGAMGQLVASNRRANWLTRLIDMEYWIACNVERAAQANFGAVMCCCGPCVVYRRSALLALLDQYETQFFRGKPSDFGEDRHLTILMLKAGLRTEYVADAIAATVVPERVWPYLLQQLRWARSTYRDAWLARPLLPRLDRYLTLDVVGQNLRPLLLALTVLTGVAQFAVAATIPWWSILALAALTLMGCCGTALLSRQARFLGFALHTFINIFLLLPLKAYAICTLSNGNWLSRNLAASLPGRTGKRGPDSAEAVSFLLLDDRHESEGRQ